jgi:hypothetical protein
VAAPLYRVIIKVSADKFIKYRGVSRFNKLYAYLDTNFSGWRWGNVYNADKKQVGSFTTKNRPLYFAPYQ